MAIQVKRSTEDIRKNSNVVLEEGQPLYTTDTNELFISDGITPVKDLKGTVVGLNLKNGATGGSIQSCEFSYIDDGSTKNVTSNASAAGAFAYGENCTASGLMSLAFGKNCTASGKRAWAGGNGVTSRGNTTIALGQAITGYAPAETYNGYTSKEGASACAIFGNGHHVLEPQCLVAGFNHKLYAKHSTTVGQGNTIQQSASGSFAGGTVASIYAPNSIAYGLHLTVPSRTITKNIYVDGKATNITLSIPTATFGSYNSVDLDGEHKALLVVGNGVHDQNRSNAFEVLWDGRAKVYGAPIEDNDVVRLLEHSSFKSEFTSFRDVIYTSFADTTAEKVINLEATDVRHDQELVRLEEAKADKATTLAGYGITDAYIKTEVNTKITNAVNTEASSRATADSNLDNKITTHTADTSNPHSVTKSQVGLSNVENKSVATIKSELTGTINSGSTGFVTGGSVYTELDKKSLYLLKTYIRKGSTGYVLCLISNKNDFRSDTGDVQLKGAILGGFIYSESDKKTIKSIIGFQTSQAGIDPFNSSWYTLDGIQVAGESSMSTLGYNKTYTVQSTTGGYASGSYSVIF